MASAPCTLETNTARGATPEELETGRLSWESRRALSNIVRERGVTTARRMLSPHSYQLIGNLSRQLHLIPPRQNEGKNTFIPFRYMGVTVVGERRFNADHYFFGPPTESVTRLVESSTRSLSVALGGLAIMGRNKLGFTIHAQELEDEAAQYEKAYADIGYPLEDLPGAVQYVPHLTFVVLNKENARQLRFPYALRGAARSLGLADGPDLTITLDPVGRNPQRSPS